MNEALKHEIEILRKEIERHNVLYYELANPLISDYEYDKLAQRLKQIASQGITEGSLFVPEGYAEIPLLV